MKKYISILLSCLLASSCTGQAGTTENAELDSAKWYYYAYAIEQNGYNSAGKKINQLHCEIKLNAIDRVSTDTVNFFFTLFYEDSSNICYLKPMEIVGVSKVKGYYYVPLFHSVVYDQENDSSMAAKMHQQSVRLRQKIYSEAGPVNSWLVSTAKSK